MNDNRTTEQESIVRSFLRKISPNRDWDYLGEHEHALIADFISDIAATLGSEREKDLESLVWDMLAYIDNCCESDLSFRCVDPVDCAYYDKARDWCTKVSSLKQRMKTLGLAVGR